MTNTIMTIHPYKHHDQWVFDDPGVGLDKEPFVAGADDIIDVMVAEQGLEEPENGFNMIFSAIPFPGHQYEFVRQEEEAGGWWYLHDETSMRGWLCPALFKYFQEAPGHLFVQVK